jgi:transcriptional regulator with XRE-family HTH domain
MDLIGLEAVQMPNRLTQLRGERGLTQQELADMCGVSRGTVSRWENQHFNPSAENITKMASVLDVDPSELESLKSNEEEGPRYVSSDDDKEAWWDIVVKDREIDDLTRVVLLRLPTEEEWVDESSDPWVITVTVDEYIERSARTREMVEKHLPKAMETPYVERIGRVEYTARLRFP